MTSTPPLVDSTDAVTKSPQTPTTRNINTTEIFDLQQTIKAIREELFDERCKVLLEKRRNKQLQFRVYQYAAACMHSVEESNQMIYHCQVLSNQNIALSHEFEKSKLIVQTLEAVIQTLSLPNRCACSPASQGTKSDYVVQGSLDEE